MKTQEKTIEFVQEGFRHECDESTSRLIAETLVRGDRPELEEKIYAEIERVTALRFRHIGAPENTPGQITALYKQGINIMLGDEPVAKSKYAEQVEEFCKFFDSELPTEEVLEKFPCDFSFLGVECDS